MVISELLVSNSVDDVLSLYKRERFKSVTTSGLGVNFKYGSIEKVNDEKT